MRMTINLLHMWTDCMFCFFNKFTANKARMPPRHNWLLGVQENENTLVGIENIILNRKQEIKPDDNEPDDCLQHLLSEFEYKYFECIFQTNTNPLKDYLIPVNITRSTFIYRHQFMFKYLLFSLCISIYLFIF